MFCTTPLSNINQSWKAYIVRQIQQHSLYGWDFWWGTKVTFSALSQALISVSFTWVHLTFMHPTGPSRTPYSPFSFPKWPPFSQFQQNHPPFLWVPCNSWFTGRGAYICTCSPNWFIWYLILLMLVIYLAFVIAFDLDSEQLLVRVSDGGSRVRALEPQEMQETRAAARQEKRDCLEQSKQIKLADD